MKVLIVEPHGDDAFISCSSTLMCDDIEKNILTFSDRDSHELGYHYEIGHSVFLDIPDVHYDLRLKYSTHDIHRKYKSGYAGLYEDYKRDMDKLLLEGEAQKSYEKFKYHFYDSLKDNEDRFMHHDLLILPLGLFHPNHYATRKIIEQYIHDVYVEDVPRIYYVDKPYIEKRYMKEILSKGDYIFTTARTQDEQTRREIFKKVYPTEQGLLRFSGTTILEWKDIYAVSPKYLSNVRVHEFFSRVSDMEEGEDKFESIVCYVPKD